MKSSSFPLFLFISIVVSIGHKCTSKEATLEIKDTLLCNNKHFSISIWFPRDVTFVKLQQTRPSAWIYYDTIMDIEYAANFDLEELMYSNLTPEEFCEKQLSVRKKIPGWNYPCGEEAYQEVEIVEQNGTPAIFTEMVCVQEKHIKYELRFLHNQGILSLVIWFYNRENTKSEIYKHRKMAKRIYKTLKIK